MDYNSYFRTLFQSQTILQITHKQNCPTFSRLGYTSLKRVARWKCVKPVACVNDSQGTGRGVTITWSFI